MKASENILLKSKVKSIPEVEIDFAKVLMQSPFAFALLIGKEMQVAMANNNIKEVWGRGNDVEGKSIFEILPEIVEQGYPELLDKVFTTGKPLTAIEKGVFLYRNKKLEELFFNFVYQPFREHNDVISGVMIIAHEVTLHATVHKETAQKEKLLISYTNKLAKKAEKSTYKLELAKKLLLQKNKEVAESRERLMSEYSRRLIEASPDPLVTISTEGIVMDMNEAMIAITDCTRKNLTGSNFEKHFTVPDNARKICRLIFKHGFVVDYPLTINDEKLTDVLFNGSVFKDGNGEVLGAVLTGRDITKQKKIEKELTEAKIFAELATSIAEEEKLKAIAAALISEEAVKSKQQFLSNMSHEIRTPMNAIIGFTKVVLKTDLTAKQKEYLTAIKLSGDALIFLINDILDLAKVNAGKMTFEQTPFKLSLSVAAMLHLFDTKIQEKNLELLQEYDEKIPAVLLGDAARLHQIILNLVSNAVKFTPKGKITVAIKLISEDEENATVEFTISDTGIGIAASKLESIFENFQQASTITSSLYGGTGLGLAIVKQLVEAQGGTVAVKSIIKEGSAFSFMLNFKKTNAPVMGETEIMELNRDIKDIKVLVVEDMALNQLLMKTLLDDFGFDRDIVNNGKLAIEKLKTTAYDIILMDLQMPEMNGFETTEYIRNTLKSSIPIIALTADVTTVDVEKCKAAGMNDYIAKPVDERLLYGKIVSLTKKPVVCISEEILLAAIEVKKKIRCIDLKYLIQRTKSNPVLMMEMISIYLKQTPPLIALMTKSLLNKDWASLHSTIHKLIPSFSIMGINHDYEVMALKVQEFASIQLQNDSIHDLVLQLESILQQSCKELEIEYCNLKNKRE